MRSGSVKQAQPAFASVKSVTPPAADTVSAAEPAKAGDSPSSAPCVWLLDGITLGWDGEPQAPINSPPQTANTAYARLNTFDMLNLSEQETRLVIVTMTADDDIVSFLIGPIAAPGITKLLARGNATKVAYSTGARAF
jgi:hypothetical protein